ncbi:MAG: AAA family ATPase [Gammaproteobacteria bacterium]
MTLSEVMGTLLSGGTLRWARFESHESGSIRLATPAARRLFDFLRKQPIALVLQGNEALFPGLVAAWKDENTDPARATSSSPATASVGPWRLQRIEAEDFGGLTHSRGDVFDMTVGATSWCLEGQNGSGKTALVNSILWALTGQRVREHAGPIEDRGQREPVLDDAGTEIGTWPPGVTYPRTREHLRSDAQASVRLTFVNPDGELAEVSRKLTSPRTGLPTVEVQIDPRIQAASQFIEAGILMPGRLSQMNFGERSQSLFDAVKRLTGLDLLADIAQGVAQQLAHAGRKFLKYEKDQGIDAKRQGFEEAIVEVNEKCGDLGLDLSLVASLESQDLERQLQNLITTCSSEAAKQIAVLKADVAASVDLAKSADREKVRDAVTTAKVLLHEKTEQIEIFRTWVVLRDASSNEHFKHLPGKIVDVEHTLQDALRWHQRQQEDRKLRLKALAAQWFTPRADPCCPLCEGAIKTPEQHALARELEELKRFAAAAERKIEEVCAGVERDLRKLLDGDLANYIAALKEMEPRTAYVRSMRERFVEREPLSDVLTGLASCVQELLAAQEASLPQFTVDLIEHAAKTDEPDSVVALRQFIHELRCLIALAGWWQVHRPQFVQAYSDLCGRKLSPDMEPPARSIRGQIRRLEDALAKADPYDLAAKRFGHALAAAKSWLQIKAEQKLREQIRDALLPLKDLRLLVEAETARSISTLSGRVEKILDQIHLSERLAYRNTGLKKKDVILHGSLAPGMKIDATLIANTSWLRAILWAFILALREETVRAHGSNLLPLLVLDDPQTTFDPRNKLKWAEMLARLANGSATDLGSAQVILTTHEHEFFVWLTEHERIVGEHGFLAPADQSSGAASIIYGGCLSARWQAAVHANNDALARDYVRHVRIHVEKFLKIMMRGEGDHIATGNLGSLCEDLKQLAARHVRPYDGPAFNNLLKSIQSSKKMVALLNGPPHSDDEHLGVAQAKDVNKFWKEQLEPLILTALKVSLQFITFRGDSRTFVHEPTRITFPARQCDELKKAILIQTGIAAAAKTDGRAGDGLLLIDEWEAARSSQVRLPNHELYRLTSGTLEPVATTGDIVIVSNYAKVHPHALVVVASGERLLARRYNEMQAHADIAVLTGQAINPYELVEPLIVVREGLQALKVVGTLFSSKLSPPVSEIPSKDEVVGVDDRAHYWAQLNEARLFKVTGRSAEPIALDGQFLMTQKAVSPEYAIQSLNGELVVAVDQEGTTYFKRLRRASGHLVILESLNPDGTTAAEIMTVDDRTSGLPRLVSVLPVVGVLFELPPTHEH